MKQKLLLLIPVLFLLGLPMAFPLSQAEIDEMVDALLVSNDGEINVTHNKVNTEQQGVNFGASTTSVDCLLGDCISFAPSDDYVVYPSKPEYTEIVEQTISFWVKMPDSGLDETIFSRYPSAETGAWRMFESSLSDNDIKIQNRMAGGSVVVGLYDFTGEWIMLTARWNVTQDTIHLDYNDSIVSFDTAAVNQPIKSNIDLWIGRQEIDTNFRFDGVIDEWEWYNISLTDEQIKYKYDENLAGRHIEVRPESTPPTFSDDGINNTAPRENYVVNINITITDESNVSGYIFSWDGGTGNFVNDTFIYFDDDITIANASVNKTIPSVPAGTTIQYQWFANDTLGNMGNSSVFSLLIAGTTAPVLTINPTNFFKADNSTYLSLADTKKVLLNLTLTDDIDLFGIEMNITNADGVECFYYSNISLSTLTDNVSVILNITSSSNADCLVEGNYTINITGWDSHTASVISDYKVDAGNDFLVFDDVIRISADNARTAKATKYEDKYTFEFTYRTWFTPKTKVFYIESDNILSYITTGYKAHFVDWVEKKWIDFDGIDGQPKVTKINDYKYRVEYANEDEKVVFSSIGGLNSQSDYFTYHLVNPTLTWYIPTTTISFFGNSSIYISLNVTSEYRNATYFRLYNISKDLIDSYNISNEGSGTYFYAHTFDGSLDMETYYLNATHFDLAGGNTTTTTLTFTLARFNITFYDEVRGDIMTDKVFLEVIGNEFAQNYTTTTSKISVPGWILEEYRLSYTSDKYAKREHYITFTNITNQSLNLYMLSLTNGTEITFTVQDNSGNDLEDALIRLKRYYLSSNSYITVAMSKTNSEGETIIDVDFNDAFYETLTTFEGFSLRTIGAKIISTTLILTMDLLPDPFATIDIIQGMITSLSFTNSTQTFVYVFTDTSGNSRTGQLDVIKRSAASQVVVCTTTDTSVSATLLCLVNTTASPGTYIALGKIIVGSNEIVTDNLERDTGISRDFMNTFGTQGAFFTIIIAGTLAGLGAGVSPAVAIIMFLVGLGIVNFLGFSIWGLSLYVSFVIAGIILIFRMKK